MEILRPKDSWFWHSGLRRQTELEERLVPAEMRDKPTALTQILTLGIVISLPALVVGIVYLLR